MSFAVLDALGIARLEKRGGDLDGSVPLRVAQACVPLLEGNAFGFQIVLSPSIELRRSPGSPRLGRNRLTAEIDPANRERVLAAHRAALVRLVAQGFVAPNRYWHRLLAGGPLQIESQGVAPRVMLWTGLLVKPDPGVCLRLSGTANRRNLFVESSVLLFEDHDAFVPLVLRLHVRDEAPERLLLTGEIATIAPLDPFFTIEECRLADEPTVGIAHVDFYDAAYFAAKKSEPTRKYRRTIQKRPEPEPPEQDPSSRSRCQVIAAGPSDHSIGFAAMTAGPHGLLGVTDRALHVVSFANLVPFEASFDGHTLVVKPDEEALAKGKRAVEETWAEAFGAEFLSAHRGALWYLTKYFTPHPPGEPHFFVKPWAFTRTPPGWSSLLEGAHGPGWDVLRGVVETDVFFATPAVFRVQRIGEPIRVAAGEPLLSVIPVPRRLLAAGYRTETWRDA